MAIYICELSEKKQAEIREKARKALSSLAYDIDDDELENVMEQKISDISDLIDISAYV